MPTVDKDPKSTTPDLWIAPSRLLYIYIQLMIEILLEPINQKPRDFGSIVYVVMEDVYHQQYRGAAAVTPAWELGASG